MNIKLTLTGNFLKQIQGAKSTSKTYLVAGMRDLSTYLLQKSIENAPKGIGALSQSMRRELDENALRATIFPSVTYGFFVHGPGSDGRTVPHWIPAREAKPGGSLYRWAQKKGANPWAVRAGIAKKGTKFQPWLKETAEKEQDKAKEILTQAVEKFVNYLSK
jgi:hypothetical protein